MFEGVSFMIVVALALAWFVQIVLSSLQMLRFHKRGQELRKLGTYMATGVAGTTYRRKVYATVVADDAHRVVAAGRLSGFTIAAGMKQTDEIVGLHIDEVGKGEPPHGISQKVWDAYGHAAGFIRNKIAKEVASADGNDDREGA